MLYIITAVHNRYNITQQFVRQIVQQTYKENTLILVDDGSDDGTSDMVLSLMPQTVILQGNGNLWWGGALHKAYKWIISCKDVQNDDYVMIANDDTRFDNEYFETAIDILDKHNKVLLTGTGISMQTGRVVDGVAMYDYSKSSTKITEEKSGNCASTRSLFFRVKDFKTIGGFHPILLPHYGSDYEWTIRACRKCDYRVIGDENLRYFANEETTGDNDYKSITKKKLFSKRSMSNPIYKFTYIILSTPIRYLPVALVNQIIRDTKKFQIFRDIMKR